MINSIQKKHIDEMNLQDFLKLEFNRYLYEDFNNSLKPYLKESNLSLFRYIYRDVVFFYSNYKTIPYEVNQHFKEKYSKEGTEFQYSIMMNIIEEIIFNATTIFKYSPSQNKYIAEDGDPFIYETQIFNCLNHEYINRETREWMEDKKISYQYNIDFQLNYNQIQSLRYFLESIDVSYKKATEGSETDLTATQAMLFHYTLQEAKLKPVFVEKVKEISELSKTYGKSAKNLEMRWNEINNSKGQSGYTKRDIIIVKDEIRQKFPEALDKFEEIVYYSI